MSPRYPILVSFFLNEKLLLSSCLFLTTLLLHSPLPALSPFSCSRYPGRGVQGVPKKHKPSRSPFSFPPFLSVLEQAKPDDSPAWLGFVCLTFPPRPPYAPCRLYLFSARLATMSFTPFAFLSPPPANLLKFPVASEPPSIPPSPHFSTLFTIPDWLFTAALDTKVPLTIAAVYAISAKALNAYNRSTGKKPWAISKTRAFNAFVVLHNVFLAVYSAWTWWGMLHALKNTVSSPTGPNGWAGTVDSFCRVHGAPGLGNGVVFNEALGKWESTAGELVLNAAGEPSRETPGRLWNEGLAFYGWLFYISKFYEVLDTLIILAKGKQSSTLQTYHHAGAMLAMWGGIRFMAAPIWIFCFTPSW